MKQINPHIEVDVYHERLTKDNIFKLIEHYDIVVDGVDNFPTRYLINDACVMKKKDSHRGRHSQVHGPDHEHQGWRDGLLPLCF